MKRSGEPTSAGGGLFDPRDVAPAEPGAAPDEIDSSAPLAMRMRPRTLDEFVGQAAIVGAGTLLRRAIEEDRLSSAIFWGPPGCGKSTLALLIARTTRAAFENYSAVTSGTADVRLVIDRAKQRRQIGRRTILFVDEIHRWNKAQQDALLPHVEAGTIALIGATTENPFFEVNAPLISRSRVFRFEALTDDDVRGLLERALADADRGLGAAGAVVEPDAMAHLVAISGGDARNALNALEAAVQAAPGTPDAPPRVTLAIAEESAQQRALRYDKSADEHYDTISAFIKSVRGSDADAAVYWLAKMLIAGEDPRFLARRLVILASEDVGNADPQGLVVASAAAQAVMFVGMPEAQLILAQATTYLATAPKSNASATAIWRATADIQARGAAPVPLHLRNAAHQGLKAFGHGAGYLYPHDFPGGWVEQEYAPAAARSGPYYEPVDRGHEAEVRQRSEPPRAGAETEDSAD